MLEIRSVAHLVDQVQLEMLVLVDWEATDSNNLNKNVIEHKCGFKPILNSLQYTHPTSINPYTHNHI